MKISINPDDVTYPTCLTIGIDDFSYGEDVMQICKKLEMAFNDILVKKEKVHVKGK